MMLTKNKGITQSITQALYKTVCCTIFTSLLFSQTSYAGHSTTQLVKAAETTDRIIIKYKSASRFNSINIQPDMAKQNASALSGATLSSVRRMSSGAYIMQLKQHKSLGEIKRLLNTLNQDAQIEYAEADLLLQPLAIPNDSRYNEQWHYFENTAGLNLPAAWDVTQGNGAVVAVIDTGFRPHIDLSANLLPGYDMISDTSVSQDGNTRDNDASDPGDWAPSGACGAGSPASNSSWHGTHVAGTIAAVSNNSTGVSGVAYAAKVVPVRVLGRCGGYTSDIADGIVWAAGGNVSGVPVNANPADVINLSLGGAGSCGFTQQNAINTARGLGASIIVAAGNENADAINSNPANCTGVITVAAVNRNGARAFYSNFGNNVDVAAPGGDTSITSNGILSTLNNGRTTPGTDSYAFYQGTSMATPHVAGVAALLYSVKPDITPDEIEQILTSTSRSFPAICSLCGSGIVDASAAVNSLNTVPVPPADNSLINGLSKTGLSGATGDLSGYTLDVPAGASNLQFNLSGGTGDADLYIKFGSAPTTSSYDCRPYKTGNNESCNITTVQAGTYHVMIRAYSSYSGATLIASYSEPPTDNGWLKSGLSASTSQWLNYSLDVPAGMSVLNIDMSGGTGDADLYVRYGSAPSTSSYLCRPYDVGNNENCRLDNPQAGTWYISIRAYSSFSGVELESRYLQ